MVTDHVVLLHMPSPWPGSEATKTPDRSKEVVETEVVHSVAVMARGLAVGDTVWGVARRVIGRVRAKALLREKWEDSLVRGKILRVDGRGRGRKWVVDWSDDGEETTVSARSLRQDRSETGSLGSRSSGSSSDESSDDEFDGSDGSSSETGSSDDNAQSHDENEEDDNEDDGDHTLLLVKKVQWQWVEAVTENVFQGPRVSPRLLWDDALPVQDKIKLRSTFSCCSSQDKKLGASWKPLPSLGLMVVAQWTNMSSSRSLAFCWQRLLTLCQIEETSTTGKWTCRMVFTQDQILEVDSTWAGDVLKTAYATFVLTLTHPRSLTQKIRGHPFAILWKPLMRICKRKSFLNTSCVWMSRCAIGMGEKANP